MCVQFVVLDECSQMTEPASLLPIARFACEKLVLVGDPKVGQMKALSCLLLMMVMKALSCLLLVMVMKALSCLLLMMTVNLQSACCLGVSDAQSALIFEWKKCC